MALASVELRHGHVITVWHFLPAHEKGKELVAGVDHPDFADFDGVVGEVDEPRKARPGFPRGTSELPVVFKELLLRGTLPFRTEEFRPSRASDRSSSARPAHSCPADGHIRDLRGAFFSRSRAEGVAGGQEDPARAKGRELPDAEIERVQESFAVRPKHFLSLEERPCRMPELRCRGSESPPSCPPGKS